MVARITPAWAGKRLVSAAHLMVYKDHPRVGGEKRVKLARKILL